MPRPNDHDDQKLLQRIAEGDSAALRELHAKTALPLHSMAMKILTSSAEAEEVEETTSEPTNEEMAETIKETEKAVSEIQRVSKGKSYIVVDSYRILVDSFIGGYFLALTCCEVFAIS